MGGILLPAARNVQQLKSRSVPRIRPQAPPSDPGGRQAMRPERVLYRV